MEKDTVHEIIACLPEGRTLFYYDKDRYALMLLGYAAAQGRTVAELKRSPYARLLDKPRVKKLLAATGNGHLRREAVEAAWDSAPLAFLLTLGTWGSRHKDSWYQTSRPGYNLVLQLNFSNQHEAAYQHLTKPVHDHVLNPYRAHPVMKRGRRTFFRNTLAWARIDLDFTHDQALIEEIQSDWVREVRDLLPDVKDCADDSVGEIYGMAGKTRNVKHYFTEVFKPYARLWDEAMLSAAIRFIREELGIRTVYYHDYETGAALKTCEPPRSLYTDLPRRFCFEKTSEMPGFLQDVKRVHKVLRKKVPQPCWQRLVL